MTKNLVLAMLVVCLSTILVSLLLETITQKSYNHKLRKYFPFLYWALDELVWVDFSIMQPFWKTLIPFYNLSLSINYFKLYYVDTYLMLKGLSEEDTKELFVKTNFMLVLGMTDMYISVEDLSDEDIEEICARTDAFCLGFRALYKDIYDLSDIEDLIKEIQSNKEKSEEETKDLEEK